MPGYTQEQLDALIAQHGGELGGPGVGRAPLPARKVKTLYPGTGVGDVPPYYVETDAPTQYRIQTSHGDITVEPQADGTYTLVSAPNAPTAAKGTEGGAPYITPQGQLYDPTKGAFTDIPGYRPAPRAPTAVGPQGGRYVDEQGQVTANIPPTAGYIDQQAQAQAAQQDTAAERWATFFRQQYADSISQAVSQGTLSETQAANVWKRMTDIFVDWPKVVGQEARAAEATRQTGASNAARYGLDVAGEARQAGENVAGPQGTARYLAEHEVGTGPGGFLTNMPDLEGARQRAAAGVYNRMPDYNALLAQQPQTPYYGPEELAQTQALAMPYVFGGGAGGGYAAQQPAYAPPPPPAYTPPDYAPPGSRPRMPDWNEPWNGDMNDPRIQLMGARR